MENGKNMKFWLGGKILKTQNFGYVRLRKT